MMNNFSIGDAVLILLVSVVIYLCVPNSRRREGRKERDEGEGTT